MLHLPDIIRDLGIILAAAGVVTLLCKILKQPVVLGYLIAGFLVSRHVAIIPTVRDEESIKVWAEMGVIFLLFGLGLEFSFKKLAQVGKSASITAIFEVVFMLGVGFVVGQILGWSSMDSLFLGGILSVSSTTIIVRAFSELGLRGKKFVSLVFGVLIVEDMVAILLLVLLSTLAATKTLAGAALLASGLRLGFFLVLWFAVGIYAVPMLLRNIRRHLSDETTLVVSLSLCLLMVILATEAGFSPALGAFVMGSILAETAEGKRIEHLLSPVRDLFGAVFFVSVGMLIDPAVLWEHLGTILLVTLITIVGKFIGSGLGSLLAGESLKTSVQAGMSLAQIGEFSFIIATLGVSLKVTSDFLYPIAVSASAVTTFTTPYMIGWSEKAYAVFSRWLPERMGRMLSAYQSTMSRSSGKRLPALVWRAHGPQILINTVLVLAIVFGSKELLAMRAGSFEQKWMAPALALTILLAASPFLWAIAFGRVSKRAGDPDIIAGLRVGLNFVRAVFALGLTVFCVTQLPLGSLERAAVLAAFLAYVLVWKRFAIGFYRSVESRFISNLHEANGDESTPTLAPWDASLAEFTLTPDSELAMQTLESSRLKERFGVTVGMIERGKKKILAPGRNERLLPHDRLFLIGTDEQLAGARAVVEPPAEEGPALDQNAFGLDVITLAPASPYAGKAIRECGIRENVHGLIVGVERSGKRLLNPDSTFELRAGDVVWLVGDRKKIQALKA